MSDAGHRDCACDRLRIPVASAVTLVWVASGFVGLWRGDIQVFLPTTGLMGILMGYLFTIKLTNRAQNGNGNGNGVRANGG